MADISKIKVNNTVYNIKDATARTNIGNAVLKSGNTQIMGVNLRIDGNNPELYLKQQSIDPSTNPSSDTYGAGFAIYDKDVHPTGRMRVAHFASTGKMELDIMGCRRVNGVDKYNTLALGLDTSGNPYVYLSAPANWRAQLNLADSGWFDLTNSSVFSGTIKYRRVGPVGQISGHNVCFVDNSNAAANVEKVMATLPSGYRPHTYAATGVVSNNYPSNPGIHSIVILSDGRIIFYSGNSTPNYSNGVVGLNGNWYFSLSATYLIGY